MTDHQVLQHIAAAPAMINIHAVHNVETICRFMRVLHEEGYPGMEILARPSLENLLELVKSINDRPERELIRLGVGTIKTEKAARDVVKLNPDFLVSPAFSRRVLDVAVEADIPYLPAVSTLQDVQDVLDAFEDVGFDVTILKLCPVEVLTYDYVEMMGSIYPGIVYCPTGTVTLETLPRWSRISCVGPAMESSFVPAEMLDKGQWQEARRILRKIRWLTSQQDLPSTQMSKPARRGFTRNSDNT